MGQGRVMTALTCRGRYSSWSELSYAPTPFENQSHTQCRELEESLGLKATKGLQESKVIMVSQAYQVLQVRWDTQDWRDPGDQREAQVSLVLRARLARGAARGPWASVGRRGPQELGRREKRVLLVIQEVLDLLALLDPRGPKVQRGPRGPQDSQVLQVHRASEGRLELRVLMERGELLDHRGTKEIRERRGLVELEVSQAREEAPVLQERRDLKDLQVPLERMERRGLEVSQDRSGCQVSEDLLDPLVMVVSQEPLDFKDLLVYPGILVSLDLKVKLESLVESSTQLVSIRWASLDLLVFPGLPVLPDPLDCLVQ